jgi:hypothetical protein
MCAKADTLRVTEMQKDIDRLRLSLVTTVVNKTTKQVDTIAQQVLPPTVQPVFLRGIGGWQGCTGIVRVERRSCCTLLCCYTCKPLC